MGATLSPHDDPRASWSAWDMSFSNLLSCQTSIILASARPHPLQLDARCGPTLFQFVAPSILPLTWPMSCAS